MTNTCQHQHPILDEGCSQALAGPTYCDRHPVISEAQTKPTIRRRIEKSVSVKGIITTSATFEATDLTDDDYRGQALEFFHWVDTVWPPPITLNA